MPPPRKPPIPPPPVRPKTAAHVQAAVAQAKLGVPSSRGPAPHVKAAIAQEKLPSPRPATVQPSMAPSPHKAPHRAVVGIPPRPRPPAVILRAEARPKRTPRMTALQLQETFAGLAKVWQAQIKAGSKDASIALESKGEKGCAAEVLYRIGYAAPDAVKGAFDSDGCHAEMDALQNYAKAGKPGIFEMLRIETEPCPRCAVVLNRLGLSAGTFYKDAGGFKDYPTWRFPDTGHNWAMIMGISAVASHPEDQTDLLKLFASQKWW